MRVPLSWLRDYVDLTLSPDELAEQLTLRGMEVSSVEVGGADWTDVVVGRLLAVERHPNADTLWLTSVDVGGGEPLQVVCGAQNIAPGQLVPVAQVGAVLPGDRRIGRSKIRGVESQGMLCSARELGLGTDAEGILILDGDGEYPLGADLRPLLGEVVLDVDVKPNRGDALSMVGLAREIAAFSGARLRLPPIGVGEDPALTAADHVSVQVDARELCPRFTARYFEGIANGPSPEWMQRRLIAAGMRPISAVVDVTNYVMHELGQPMHAYDATHVPHGRVVVRTARAGERLTTIDHQERELDERMLVVADEHHPVGLAGIMGGASTEVSETTTRVILESAIFHGPNIRNTARRLALRSEASMRHEKGIDPNLPPVAADRAAALLAEITGARVATGIVDSAPGERPRRSVGLDLDRAERLLGIPLAAPQVERLLAPLGFAVGGSDRQLEVSVPTHRLDTIIPADVAEEIARAYGYDRIPGRVGIGELPPYRLDPGASRHAIRRTLAALGLDEIVTHALIGPEDLRRSGYDVDGEDLVRVANPISVEHSLLRPVIYPSLLRALAENVRQRRSDAWLFEVGKVYWRQEGGRTQPTWMTAGTGRYEQWLVGIAMLGARLPRAVETPQVVADVAEIKGIVEALHRALGAPLPAYRAEEPERRHAHLHPGRAAVILNPAGRPYGSIGEVDPRIAAGWDLPGRPVMAALDLGQLLELLPQRLSIAPVPAAQPLDRDLAVVVEESTPLGEVLRIARTTAGEELVDLRLFDVYRGPQVGEGRVSYALALRFQPVAAGDEKGIEKALNRVRGALRHHLRAEIR
ncbi:MAG TPA: phenylalanine--tRNA ligase subunit beta [Candidatus Limnocylindria bacterium]|nr:phenylalanine--tRNA ligase subunit beta [Candidatus Limnocylindria bacterium]